MSSERSHSEYVVGSSHRTRPPFVSRTGSGYKYVRCKRGGTDDIIYMHQLCAIAGGADPHDVFSDAHEVHHIIPFPWLNTPGNVQVIPKWEHPGNTVGRDGLPEADEVFDFESPDDVQRYASTD